MSPILVVDEAMSPILVVDEAMSPILVVDEAMSPFVLETDCSQEVLADEKGGGGTLLNCCPCSFSLAV
ncbi:hypothetical protein SH449x_003944 [Pirellulaceae bacterium SH449]